MMGMSNVRVVPIVCTLVLGVAGTLLADTKQNDVAVDDSAQPLKSIMADVLDSTAYLMSRSFYSSVWDSFQGDELAQEKLETLVKSAEAMDQHADLTELERRYLSRSFSDTVALAKESFEADAGAWAWYAMLDLTEHCAACHTLIPGRANLAIGDRLVENVDIDSLERYQGAQLYAAVRQFDKALSVLEAEFLDSTVKPTQSELSGAFFEYLNIIISTDKDYARATKTFDGVLARDDVPYYLRRRIEVWRMSLSTLSQEANRAVTPVAAQGLYDRATELNAIPGMGDGAVLDLAAAAIYRDYIASKDDVPKGELAKAYFTLALIELRNTRVRIAVPEMELLLQATIQADPSGPLARPAYSLLEEFGVNAENEGVYPLTTRPSLIDLTALREMIGI